MLAAQAFDEMIRANVGAVLKSRGYSRDKQTFYLRQYGNWGIINFQKSDVSTSSVIKFTINLGVCSIRLLSVAAPARLLVKRPVLWDCQWRERLGFLIPENRDVWWTIRGDSDTRNLAQMLEGLMQTVAAPEVERNLSDESLRDLWLTGVCPGLDNSYRLAYLAVLLRALGPAGKLDEVLTELRTELREHHRPAVEDLLKKIEAG